MNYFVKIDNGVVVQKQPYKAEGFIKAPKDVVCGMLYDGENFTKPEQPEPQEQPLSDLEQFAKNLLDSGKVTEAEIPQGIRERILQDKRISK